ncbi:ferritin-like domain-containing protein [Conexibacter woesei]|uniref:ferritin-like domain-containing protein n=1 Tax=Conexibacter woesei TaxID=191495 RepID=UPI00042974E0|nr:ferritin-like domain-containing protein [Conexibacter woesei]
MAHERLTRRGLVAAAATTGGVLLASLPDAGDAAPSAGLDRKILTFALLLEDVQAGFYADALRKARLQGELLDYARTVGAQETRHAQTLRHALGDGAPAPPRLDFGDDTADPERFARSALRLEDLGVKAYITQAAHLTPGALAAAARIATVEARHAAWIRDLAGLDPAPDAVEPQLSADTVRRTLEGSGYVR